MRPIMLVLAAIPAAGAALLAGALLAQPDIPFSAANPTDRLELEYTRHDLEAMAVGGVERVGSRTAETIRVMPDGSGTYAVIERGRALPEASFQLDQERMLRLVAFVKETGIASIPAGSVAPPPDLDSYTMSSLKVTLNGRDTKLAWVGQNDTDAFVPPVLAQMDVEMSKLARLAAQ